MFDRILVLILALSVALVSVSMLILRDTVKDSMEVRERAEIRAEQFQESNQKPKPVQVTRDQILNFEAHKEQIECLATNLYFEARGEPRDGQIAVALVTINRVKSSRYPDSVCDVVYQARRDQYGTPIRHQCQFSWYCDGKREQILDIKSYNTVRAVAEYVYINHYLNPGAMRDTTRGSTHYHADRVEPFWSRHPNYQEVAQIGQHIFYQPTY